MKEINLQNQSFFTGISKFLCINFICLGLLITTYTASAQTLWARSGNNISSVDVTAPGTVLNSGEITGISANQTIEGMDFRPLNGKLYLLGYESSTGIAQLYTLDLTTYGASAIGNTFAIEIGQSEFGFDFNPTVDRIRVTTAQQKNYRIHPVSGAIAATDGNLAYAAGDPNAASIPAIGSVAYTNSYIGATSTTLYTYDDALDILNTQNPPNNGTQNTVGSTGIVDVGAGELDIYYNPATGTNTAYFKQDMNVGGPVSQLFRIDLVTGAVTLIGNIGTTTVVNDIAVQIDVDPLASIEGQLIYGLASNGYLISFDSENSAVIRTHQSISGITAGQVLVGLDSRPNTGELYALGYNTAMGESQLYTINQSTGAATSVGVAATLASGMTNISFDFNPTVDRIRVTSAQDNNYRLHPVTGAIAATDGTLVYEAADVNAGNDPNIGAGAYTNSYIGATSTQLFGYDVALNILTLQNPPNNGTLNTIGASGITVNSTEPSVDMDFFYDTESGMNLNYLIANTGTSTSDSLYSINMATGAVMALGKIGNGSAVTDIAVQIIPDIPAEVAGQIIYGLTSNGYLISFDSENPSVIRTHRSISGITAGQVLAGMDSRPATGELYAMGYDVNSGEAQLYTIDPSTGIATAVGSTVTLAISMSNISFDFNPTVDRIRVTSAQDNNYRLHPVTGAVAATDGTLAYESADVNGGTDPNVGAGAYTNSYIGATSTQLFGYDFSLNILTLQNPPNNGTLNTIGASGIIVNAAEPSIDLDFYFDADSGMNLNFLVANTGTSVLDSLYSVDRTTGDVTAIGRIGNGSAVTDIAVQIIPNIPDEVAGQIIYGITNNNNLITFDSEAPDVIRTQVAISGVMAGQVIVGIDVRPATGELYALGYNATNGEAQLYTINETTGAVVTVAVPVVLESNQANIGFDFNPTVDRIRVVTSGGFNYRLHPVTGAIAATDGMLTYNAGDVNNGTAPSVGTAAYTNSFGGSNNTRLFVYDDALNIIALQNPPNNGTLNTVGSSGIVQSTTDITSDLDIFYNHELHTNTVFLSANTGTNDNLYTVNIATGSATLVGAIGNGVAVRDIAVSNDSITTVSSTTSMITITACDTYIAPDNKQYSASGTYTAIIPNLAGYDSLITIVLTIDSVDNTIALTDSLTIMSAEQGGIYQWIDCATQLPIAGATMQSYTVSESGSYAVIVTSAAGCTDTSACIQVTTSRTKYLSQSNIKVFPNPSSGVFTIDLRSEVLTGEIKVSDINGRELRRYALNGNLTSIDLSELPGGTYILRIGNVVHRIMKQ